MSAIPAATVLLLELQRLYESCVIRIREAERLPGAQPPAGPPKSDLLHGAGVFSKNMVHHADLGASRSRATEFSWTSRFQNLKL